MTPSVDQLAGQLVQAIRAELAVETSSLHPGRHDPAGKRVPLPVQPPPAPLADISKVWVALAVWQKPAVAEPDHAANVTPITGGRMGIFNRPDPPPPVTRFEAQVVAVSLSHDTAAAAVEAHRQDHADCDYEITAHEIDRSF